jgi:PDZ domain-containing secreted protein
LQSGHIFSQKSLYKKRFECYHFYVRKHKIRTFLLTTLLLVALFVPIPQERSAYRTLQLSDFPEVGENYVVVLFYYPNLMSNIVAKVTHSDDLTFLSRKSSGSQKQEVNNGNISEDPKLKAWTAANNIMESHTPHVTNMQWGTRIEKLATNTPLYKAGLRIGDVVIKVDHNKATTENILRILSAGQTEANVVYVRDGKKYKTHVSWKNQGSILYGTHFVPVPEGTLQPPSTIEPIFELGSSRQFTYTLAYLDVLTPESLHQGRIIAATGVISSEGRVTSIDGIEAKLRAAEQANADVFFVPAVNYDKIKDIPTSVRVVPVSTVTQALIFLCENQTGVLCDSINEIDEIDYMRKLKAHQLTITSSKRIRL